MTQTEQVIDPDNEIYILYYRNLAKGDRDRRGKQMQGAIID